MGLVPVHYLVQIRFASAEQLHRLFVQEVLQRDAVVQVQFTTELGALVVEGPLVIVAQDLADAGRFHSQCDHPAQDEIVPGQVVGLFQLGQQPAVVEIGQDEEAFPDGASLSARSGQDAVQPFGQQVLVVSALRGRVGDIGK